MNWPAYSCDHELACDLSLRLMSGSLPSFAGWSGFPSIAALSINPGIDVMGQHPTSCNGTDQQAPVSKTANASNGLNEIAISLMGIKFRN
jgi:hypothetical protein